MKALIGVACALFLSSSFAEEGLIIADGFGASDLTKVPLEQQAKMMARRAAQVDAQRNLAEQIKGLRLTGGTTMEDFEVSSDIVATRVKGVLRGAFELSSTTTKDGDAIVVEVKMAICANGFHEKCKNRPNLEDAMALASTVKQ
ncbi:MAG: hypothetical protein WA981_04180 [Glaciecola sp.]